jgi:hypothetical protein
MQQLSVKPKTAMSMKLGLLGSIPLEAEGDIVCSRSLSLASGTGQQVVAEGRRTVSKVAQTQVSMNEGRGEQREGVWQWDPPALALKEKVW